jgi:3-phytase
MRIVLLAALLFAGGCATAPPIAMTAGQTAVVTARGETVPVGTANDDAADDPAIWRNPRNPSASLIVATDKKAGLYVYGMDGQVRHFAPVGRMNNVDLVDRGRSGILVVASDRNDIANAKLQLYRLDPASGALQSLGSAPGGAGEAYGVCLLDSRDGLFAFSVLKDGAVHQVQIDSTGSGGRIVRSMRLATQTEGCVADPRTNSLYVGEEARGVWRFDARPRGPTVPTLVAPMDGKQLVADVEGLALAPSGAAGGYLLVSSQGDNAYALYRLPDFRPIGRFRVGAGTFGSTEETDGIALAGGSFGPDYGRGLLVVQDGQNEPRAQNFKYVSWADVLAAMGSGQ